MYHRILTADCEAIVVGYEAEKVAMAFSLLLPCIPCSTAREARAIRLQEVQTYERELDYLAKHLDVISLGIQLRLSASGSEDKGRESLLDRIYFFGPIELQQT